ncbi:hypothetical protein [Rothia aeria]|nr:hypothetical protein [Rothia sp. RSM482]
MSAHSLVGRAVSAALFLPFGCVVFWGAAGLSMGAANTGRLPAGGNGG